MTEFGIRIIEVSSILIRYTEYFNNHSDIPEHLRKPLMRMLHQTQMASDGSVDLHQVSVKGTMEYFEDGNTVINWKEKAYGTVFDILMVCVQTKAEVIARC